MGNVTKLRGGATLLHGAEATARVIAWLRENADLLESGAARPVHKAVLTVYESCGDQARTFTTFCNTTAIERAGIMAMALHDTLEGD